MINCRNISCKNIFRTSRMVFQGAPGEGAKPAAPTFDELSRLADAADKAAKDAPKPEDKLTKAEEQKVDDVQKKIDEKEAGGRKLNPDTKAAYDAFKEKHARYEELAKSENAVAESRKELVTYLRDILMKGGTDTALVAAYRKEAAERKVSEEAQKKEVERIAAAEKVEEGTIMANAVDFQARYLRDFVTYSRSLNKNNANTEINLLTYDLNTLSMDAQTIQKWGSVPANQRPYDDQYMKQVQERLDKHPLSETIAKCRQLNQVLTLEGHEPFKAYEGPTAKAGENVQTAPAPAPKPQPAPAPAPKEPPKAPAPAPAPTPAPTPAPQASPALVAQAPQQATPAPKPEQKPAITPAPAPKPAEPAKPAAVAQAPKTPPAKPAATPPATVAQAQPNKNVDAAKKTPPRAAQQADERARETKEHETYFTSVEGYRKHLSSKVDATKLDLHSKRDVKLKLSSTLDANAVPFAKQLEEDLKEIKATHEANLASASNPREKAAAEKAYRDELKMTRIVNVPLVFTDENQKEVDVSVRIELPNAYGALENVQRYSEIYKAPGIRFVLAKKNDMTISSRITSGPDQTD